MEVKVISLIHLERIQVPLMSGSDPARDCTSQLPLTEDVEAFLRRPRLAKIKALDERRLLILKE